MVSVVAAWPMVTLDEVLRPTDRSETPVAGKTYRTVGVKWWGEGVYEREPIDGSQTRYSALRRIEAGDIIINKIWARHGSVAVVQPSLTGCYASTEFPTWVADPNRLVPLWMHWLSKTEAFWEQCDEKSRGTSGKNRIRPERFLEIPIPLPPLDEQRRIVARIAAIAARVEEARGLRRAAMEEAEALVDSARTIQFEADDGSFTRLADVVTLERGRFSHRPRNDPMYFGGTHPWIQIAEVEASDKYIRQWTATLNDDGLAVSRKFPKGTVLVSIAATIGAVGILDFDCCIPDSIVAVTPKPRMISDYVYHYLKHVRTHLEEIAPQSAQKNINIEILVSLPIPAVSIAEQRRIVAYLDDLQTRVDALKRLQAESAAELEALLPSVLDRAFRGEL